MGAWPCEPSQRSLFYGYNFIQVFVAYDYFMIWVMWYDHFWFSMALADGVVPIYFAKPSWTNRMTSLIARFMGPPWGLSGTNRTHVGPMLAPWTLLKQWVVITHPCPTLAWNYLHHPETGIHFIKRDLKIQQYHDKQTGKGLKFLSTVLEKCFNVMLTH